MQYRCFNKIDLYWLIYINYTTLVINRVHLWHSSELRLPDTLIKICGEFHSDVVSLLHVTSRITIDIDWDYGLDGVDTLFFTGYDLRPAKHDCRMTITRETGFPEVLLESWWKTEPPFHSLVSFSRFSAVFNCQALRTHSGQTVSPFYLKFLFFGSRYIILEFSLLSDWKRTPNEPEKAPKVSQNPPSLQPWWVSLSVCAT